MGVESLQSRGYFYYPTRTMAITKEKKTEVVEKVHGIAQTAKTIVFANFKKLPVNQQNELRQALRAQGIGYTVAKKNLVRRGFGDTFAGDIPELNGEISLVYGEDELAPAREFAVFVKKYPEQLAFAGGVFGGKYITKDEITSIAAIPGMQILRAQFVQLINSPLQRLAVVLDQIAQKQ